MAEDRLNAWEILFRRALEIVDSVSASGTRFDDWSFGGGTVLMRRYRHRVSKDVYLFVPDPQYLGYVSPSSLLKIMPPMMETSFPRTREPSKPLISFASKILGPRLRGGDERISTNC